MNVPKLLIRLAKKHGSQKALAENLNVTEPYLSAVIIGRNEPGPAILDPLGLERVVSYRRKRAAAQ